MNFGVLISMLLKIVTNFTFLKVNKTLKGYFSFKKNTKLIFSKKGENLNISRTYKSIESMLNLLLYLIVIYIISISSFLSTLYSNIKRNFHGIFQQFDKSIFNFSVITFSTILLLVIPILTFIAYIIIIYSIKKNNTMIIATNYEFRKLSYVPTISFISSIIASLFCLISFLKNRNIIAFEQVQIIINNNTIAFVSISLLIYIFLFSIVNFSIKTSLSQVENI